MELADVQRLLPVEATKNKLVAREIPELEQSIKEKQRRFLCSLTPLTTCVVSD
jgi:TATA-binding protein-associated factor Taf7